MLVFFRCDLDLCRFFLALCKTPNDASLETPQYFVFLLSRHSKKHDNAIAEKHDKRPAFDTEGQGSCRQDFLTFKPRGIDAIAEQ